MNVSVTLPIHMCLFSGQPGNKQVSQIVCGQLELQRSSSRLDERSFLMHSKDIQYCSSISGLKPLLQSLNDSNNHMDRN